MIFSIRNLGFELGSLLLEGLQPLLPCGGVRGAAAGAWLAGAAAFVPQGVPCPAAPQLAAGRYCPSCWQRSLPWLGLQRLTLQRSSGAAKMAKCRGQLPA